MYTDNLNINKKCILLIGKNLDSSISGSLTL